MPDHLCISKVCPVALGLWLMLLLLLPPAARAKDVRYVADRIIVSLRENPGNGPRVTTLKTDDPVEVLQERASHLQVRTRDDQTGWVASQYITTEIPKSLVIARLNEEVDSLRATVAELEKDQPALAADLQAARIEHSRTVEDLQTRLDHFRTEAEQADRELKTITEKYAALAESSSDVTGLLQRHEKLSRAFQRLEQEAAQLRTRMQRPRPPAMLWWFLAGAGVFCLGLLSGAVIRKKKYYIDV